MASSVEINLSGLELTGLPENPKLSKETIDLDLSNNQFIFIPDCIDLTW